MIQDNPPQPDANVRLRGTERRQMWLRDARRFHTKNLFGLWLLLVLGTSAAIILMLVREEFSVMVPISLLLVLLIVFTGAYVFQEAARIHRRIDAILKLHEEAERK